MKKLILPLLAAGAFQSCDPSVFPGDDLGNNCTINYAQGSCERVDANTLYIKALLLNNNFDCNQDERIDIGVTVYTPGGVSTYELLSDQGQTLRNERPNDVIAEQAPNQSLEGTITTNIAGANATVEIWTINLDGTKEIIDTYTTNCDQEPDCEVACTATCFEITTNNHCQGTSIYSFDLCNKPTTFAGTLSLDGMEFGRLSNGAYGPITIYIKNGSQTTGSFTVTPVFEAGFGVIGRFTVNLNPGEKLFAQIGTKKAITSGNVKLTVNSGGIYQEIITPFNDKDCTR